MHQSNLYGEVLGRDRYNILVVTAARGPAKKLIKTF